jgi:hypothetical protein
MQVFGPKNARVRHLNSGEAFRRQPLKSTKFEAPFDRLGGNHATLPRQRDCMSVLIQKCWNYCMLRQLLYSRCILDFLRGVLLACLFKHWRASIVAMKSIADVFFATSLPNHLCADERPSHRQRSVLVKASRALLCS